MSDIFFYGKNNEWSIRFDHVTQTYVGVNHVAADTRMPMLKEVKAEGTLDVVTIDGKVTRLSSDEVQRFMKEYRAFLSNINQQGFLQEMVKK